MFSTKYELNLSCSNESPRTENLCNIKLHLKMYRKMCQKEGDHSYGSLIFMFSEVLKHHQAPKWVLGSVTINLLDPMTDDPIFYP